MNISTALLLLLLRYTDGCVSSVSIAHQLHTVTVTVTVGVVCVWMIVPTPSCMDGCPVVVGGDMAVVYGMCSMGVYPLPCDELNL